MDDKNRKQITAQNEDYVRQWFEGSGFARKKLDTKKAKLGGSADWRFTKRELVVICEVKTIFSGGQSGLTADQYERRRCEFRRKIDHGKAKARTNGIPLIVSQEDLDYIEGKIPYPKQHIRKESEFDAFMSDVRARLENDQDINRLPFSVSISMDGMYVAYREERQQFVNWLKGFVLWANQHHHAERCHSTSTFTFISPHRTEKGIFQSGIEAFVQISGPLSYYSQLDVGFIEGGGIYNEAAIANTIAEAVLQIRTSVGAEQEPNTLPVIALWSASGYLNFSMLLAMDADGAQLHELPDRYYLFDWAFSEYPDLAAIILYQLSHDGDFVIPSPDDKWFPVGYIITNPNMPNAETALRAAIVENCGFITGITSDPLNQPIG